MRWFFVFFSLSFSRPFTSAKHADITSITKHAEAFNDHLVYVRASASSAHCNHLLFEQNAYFSFQCIRILALDMLKDVNFVGHYLSPALAPNGRSQHEIIIKCDIFTQVEIYKENIYACCGFVQIISGETEHISFLPPKTLLKRINFCNSKHLTWNIRRFSYFIFFFE